MWSQGHLSFKVPPQKKWNTVSTFISHPFYCTVSWNLTQTLTCDCELIKHCTLMLPTVLNWVLNIKNQSNNHSLSLSLSHFWQTGGQAGRIHTNRGQNVNVCRQLVCSLCDRLTVSIHSEVLQNKCWIGRQYSETPVKRMFHPHERSLLFRDRYRLLILRLLFHQWFHCII